MGRSSRTRQSPTANERGQESRRSIASLVPGTTIVVAGLFSIEDKLEVTQMTNIILALVLSVCALASSPFLSSRSCLENNQVNGTTWKLQACPTTECDNEDQKCSVKAWSGYGVTYYYCGCDTPSDPAHHKVCHSHSVWHPPIGDRPGSWSPGCTFSRYTDCPKEKPKCRAELEVANKRCTCQATGNGQGW